MADRPDRYGDPRAYGGRSPPSSHRPSNGPYMNSGFEEPYDARYDERDYRAPPGQDPYFDPPPRVPRDYSPESDPYNSAYDQRARRGSQGQPPNHYDDRPYAPADPRPHAFNQIAPFDDAKADAEWRRGYEERRRSYGDYGRRRSRPYDDGYSEYDDRSYDDRRYDDDYDNPRYDDRRTRSASRRRPRHSPVEEIALRYPADSQRIGGKDVLGGSEHKHGLGATLAGAGGGALLGHEFTDNAIGTIGGAIAGAVVARFVEKKVDQRKALKELALRRDDADIYEPRDDRRRGYSPH